MTTLVTGVTGNVGRYVVRGQLNAGEPVRADDTGMDHVSSDIRELTGRPALDYAAWVADHADDFR